MSTRSFFPEARKAVFRNRPNRFIVECELDGKKIRAYLPNPGRLWELFFPGVVIHLVPNDPAQQGSTDHTVVAVEREGIPIMLHTHANNLVARRLIEQGLVPGLENARIIRPEVRVGSSRFDFLLEQQGRDVIVEVKSCTLVGDRIAMFPDAITARGTRHVLELAHLAEQGMKTAVLFIVHWQGARWFLPEHHTDLEFSRTLLAVKDRVLVRAIGVGWTTRLALSRTVRNLDIPWQLVEKEAHDRGCYIIVLRLDKGQAVAINSLGTIRFKKGYYCYVGSALANLTQRVERHKRLTKKHHWHIDHLRAVAIVHAAIPIRASEDLECELAAALKDISGWPMPQFGSSDCSCESHLFGWEGDPLHDRRFIDVLMQYRINRLETYLGR
jgi:sugar fermentation stimulation protein A